MGYYDEYANDLYCDIERDLLEEVEEQEQLFGFKKVTEGVTKKFADVLEEVQRQDWNFNKKHHVDTKITYNKADDIMLEYTRKAETEIVDRIIRKASRSRRVVQKLKKKKTDKSTVEIKDIDIVDIFRIYFCAEIVGPLLEDINDNLSSGSQTIVDEEMLFRFIIVEMILMY